MQLTGLKWVGTRTNKFDDTLSFYRDVMKLEVVDKAIVRLIPTPKRRRGRGLQRRRAGPHVLHEGPGRRELEARGVELIGETHGAPGSRWSTSMGPTAMSMRSLANNTTAKDREHLLACERHMTLAVAQLWIIGGVPE